MKKIKDFFAKIKEWFKSNSFKNVWDKFTTGILILLMASPLLILLYLLLWFLLKN